MFFRTSGDMHSFRSSFYWVVRGLRAHLLDMIVTYGCFTWRIQCCLKGRIPSFDSFASVATHLEVSGELVVNTTMNNCLRKLPEIFENFQKCLRIACLPTYA